MGPCGGCGVGIGRLRNGMGFFGVSRWFRTVIFLGWNGGRRRRMSVSLARP
jgi:hypothetical protein